MKLFMVTKPSSEEVTFFLKRSLMEADVCVGKSIREGMGQATNRSSEETLDLVVTNALIIDWSGIYKVTFISHRVISIIHILVGRYWR